MDSRSQRSAVPESIAHCRNPSSAVRGNFSALAPPSPDQAAAAAKEAHDPETISFSCSEFLFRRLMALDRIYKNQPGPFSFPHSLTSVSVYV
jgi:hypothetical protein